jgi:hypothetical protein
MSDLVFIGFLFDDLLLKLIWNGISYTTTSKTRQWPPGTETFVDKKDRKEALQIVARQPRWFQPKR